jgi:hypothetical protein
MRQKLEIETRILMQATPGWVLLSDDWKKDGAAHAALSPNDLRREGKVEGT